MRKAFKYRLYPNKEQQCLLERHLEECRWLYNHLLGERRDAWEQRQESVRLYDQHALLPALKAARASLAGVQSQVLQNVAVKTFATLSTEQTIANPQFFRHEEQALAKAQRRLAKAEQGTRERAERRKVVARVYERSTWRRNDFTHQHSRRIVNQFDLIAVEDLAVNRMVHNQCLAKSIHDAAWSQFADLLLYKAAWAGRRYSAVNPAYTSQDCSQCGHRQLLSLSDRTYTCPCCGMVLDRDFNASLNILRLGQQSLASA